MADDARVVMAWAPVDGHAVQIVGTLNPETRAEQWLPECSCGWIGDVCAASVTAQENFRKHLAESVTRS